MWLAVVIVNVLSRTPDRRRSSARSAMPCDVRCLMLGYGKGM